MSHAFSRKLIWLLAAIAGTFHLVFAIGPFIASPNDWVPAVALCFWDYPIARFLQVTGLYDNRFNNPVGGWLYGILGTAMYAGFGALIGYVIDKLRRKRQAST
jgi:hypothetical protein